MLQGIVALVPNIWVFREGYHCPNCHPLVILGIPKTVLKEDH